MFWSVQFLTQDEGYQFTFHCAVDHIYIMLTVSAFRYMNTSSLTHSISLHIISYGIFPVEYNLLLMGWEVRKYSMMHCIVIGFSIMKTQIQPKHAQTNKKIFADM